MKHNIAMTEEEEKIQRTKQLLHRVFNTPDGRQAIDHLQKVFLPAPSSSHHGISEQCLFGRAEVVMYLVRHAAILQP
jgi:hypothetical protein